ENRKERKDLNRLGLIAKKYDENLHENKVISLESNVIMAKKR
ncbi:hypothetical protein KSS87_002446, partial [Heliosperma pusillum]